MHEVPESSGDAYEYGFYVWDSEAIKVVINKSNKLSSKNTSEQDEKGGKGPGGDDMELVEVHVTNTVHAMSV